MPKLTNLLADQYLTLEEGKPLIEGYFTLNQLVREEWLSQKAEGVKGLGSALYFHFKREFPDVDLPVHKVRHFSYTRTGERGKEQRGTKRFYPETHRAIAVKFIAEYLEEATKTFSRCRYLDKVASCFSDELVPEQASKPVVDIGEVIFGLPETPFDQMVALADSLVQLAVSNGYQLTELFDTVVANKKKVTKA